MSVSIGAIVLSDHLLLPGVKNLPSRAGSVRQTISGKIIDQTIPIGAGTQLVLTDPGDFGLFSGTQIDAVNNLRATREQVVFVHHVGSWTVVVDEVDVIQSDGFADPGVDDTYYGTITLLVV